MKLTLMRRCTVILFLMVMILTGFSASQAQSGPKQSAETQKISVETASEKRPIKTIGIIGGVSWASSIEYYRIMNESVRDRLGGVNSAQILFSTLRQYILRPQWIIH